MLNRHIRLQGPEQGFIAGLRYAANR